MSFVGPANVPLSSPNLQYPRSYDSEWAPYGYQPSAVGQSSTAFHGLLPGITVQNDHFTDGLLTLILGYPQRAVVQPPFPDDAAVGTSGVALIPFGMQLQLPSNAEPSQAAEYLDWP